VTVATVILHELIAASFFVTFAIAVVLASRNALRALFGPMVAYYVWLMVPIVLLVLLLPVHETTSTYLSFVGTALPLSQHLDAPLGLRESSLVTIVLTWTTGACLTLLILLWQQARFVRGLTIVARRDGILYAQRVLTGPLVVGIVRPQIVLPLDFGDRYTMSEQEVVIAHERMHVQRGDPIANAICAFLRCAFWFDPLVHFAANRFRFDQELACDEAVIRHNPTSQQSYANAMLKTHLANPQLPLACHWPSHHPLKARIVMLKKRLPSRGRQALGSLVTGFAIITIGYGAWAAQPTSSTLRDGNPSPGDTSFPRVARGHESALLARGDVPTGSCFRVSLKAYRGSRRQAVMIVGLAALRESSTVYLPGNVVRTDVTSDFVGRTLGGTSRNSAAESVRVLVFICTPRRTHAPLLLAV
jgi:bla regulator protein blaR1